MKKETDSAAPLMPFWQLFQHIPLGYRDAYLRMVGGLSALAILVVLLVAYSLNNSYHATRDAARASVENIAALLYEDVGQSISSVDRALGLTVSLLQERGEPAARDAAFLRDFTQNQRFLRPEIGGIYISDPQGRIVFPKAEPGVAATSIADREYFKNLLDNPDRGLVISSPVVGRISGQRVLVMARAYRLPGGQFGGVVAATIPVSRYADRFSALQIDKQDIFNLFDSQRLVILRFPEQDANGKSLIGVRLGSATLMQMLDEGRTSGTYQAVSPLDQIERTSTFRLFDRLPLGMVVGISVESYMAKWREEATRTVSLVAAFLALGACLTWLILQAWKRQARTRNFARAIVDSSPVALYSRDANGCVTQWNRAAQAMFGWTEAEALGQPLLGLSAQESEESAALIRRVMAGETIENLELTRTQKGGNRVDINAIMAPLRDSNQKVIGVISLATNVTESKKAARHIAHMAYHDVLTGLPNRALLQDRFLQAAALAQRAQRRMALIFLDLDNFKTINDSLGHGVGDAVLCEFAARLTRCLRETDTLSRHGGDEFLLLLPDLSQPEDISTTLQKVLYEARLPFNIDGHELASTVSIGVSTFPDDGTDFDTLLRLADIAMYQSKAAGKDRATFFDAAMNDAAQEHLLLRNGLRQALERQEFVLHYQPQFKLDDGALIGVEALIRWQHPAHGLVAPGRFIGVAEESGLIVPMGEWVLQEACRQAVAWMQQGLVPGTMAVNLSVVQFTRCNIEHVVSEALAASGLPAHCLELELTESILVHDVEAVLATVKRLKALGVQISIDDFGTGYSSLAYLQRFAVDKLKIDQAFVRNIVSNKDDAAIVRAIIDLAGSLGLMTISEGIESLEVAQCLRAMGCHHGQGYHFARPMPAPDMAVFMDNRRGV